MATLESLRDKRSQVPPRTGWYCDYCNHYQTEGRRCEVCNRVTTYLPTPEKIAEEMEAIQKTWRPGIRRKRTCYKRRGLIPRYRRYRRYFGSI